VVKPLPYVATPSSSVQRERYYVQARCVYLVVKHKTHATHALRCDALRHAALWKVLPR
jgi:hypothetical protein